MSDWGETRTVTGRKPHRCEACLYPIAVGEKHEYSIGVFDGEWQAWRMHLECFAALEDGSGHLEFTSGELPPPERLRKTGGAA